MRRMDGHTAETRLLQIVDARRQQRIEPRGGHAECSGVKRHEVSGVAFRKFYREEEGARKGSYRRGLSGRSQTCPAYPVVLASARRCRQAARQTHYGLLGPKSSDFVRDLPSAFLGSVVAHQGKRQFLLPF